MDFTGLLQDNGIQISMDGKGCWRDNVFVERLWKSVKYEEVYLYAYDCVNEAKRGLEKYFVFYNQSRPHTALDDQTPDEFYFGNLPALPKAEQALTARLPLKKWKILSNYSAVSNEGYKWMCIRPAPTNPRRLCDYKCRLNS